MNASLAASGQPAKLPPYFRVRLLGTPILAWNNSRLAISRRSVRALLYRLACSSEPLARGQLQLLFWSEVPESVARRNLSHLLTHLRRALPMPQVLVTTGDEVCLDSSQIWCDVVEFKHISFDPTCDAILYHHFADLYRGPFLESFGLPDCAEFEHWCTMERTSIEQQYLKIIEHLVEHYAEGEEINQAIKFTQRYLEIDPLSESMHRRLIQFYAAAGDRHLALKQFESCCSILKKDLGVSPLPETQSVYQAVISGEPRFPKPPSRLHPPHFLEAEVPVIGREGELQKLDQTFHDHQEQKGRVVFISGEAGVGKSCLMREFAARHQDEVQLLYGCGYAGEQAIPYQPILPLLRSILGLVEKGVEDKKPNFPIRQTPPDFIEPVWLSEISRLFPEMHMIYPELPSPLPIEPETARTRLFDAICHLILSYSLAQGPVLLCLDDLQWMDETTKAWLAHIGRYLSRGAHPILILGTYRSEEAETLLDVRHTLARAGVLAELKLTGLEEAAVLGLVRHLVGLRSGDEVLARKLHQATGGNPFYLIEILQMQIEERGVEKNFQGAMHFSLPESIRAAVQDRLQRLSPISYQVLEAGAVLGQSFGIELLRLTAGRSHIEIMASLEELVARMLLAEDPQEYRFVHEIVRQHVEEYLGQVRRQLLHRRAGRAYERINPEAFPALAYHFELGGEQQKALHHHGLAARQAQALFAWQLVEFHQGRMLELLASIDPGNSQPELVQLHGEVLSGRAFARYLQGRLAERDDDLISLNELGEASNDDQIRLQAFLHSLRYLNLDGEYSQAILVAEKGLSLLGSSPDLFTNAERISAVRSRLLAQIGFAYYFLGKPREALGVLEEAWNLCEEITDPDLRVGQGLHCGYQKMGSPCEEKVTPGTCGRILHVLGYVYFHLGDYCRALEYQQRAGACHQKAGDHNNIAWDLMDIGTQHQKLGDLVEAKRFLREGLELACRVGSLQAKSYGLAQLGSLDLYQGDYAAAMARYQESLMMEQVTQNAPVNASAEAGMGLSWYHLGDYAQSRHWSQRALQSAQETGLRRWIAEAMIKLGLLDMVEGCLSMAHQHLEEGLAIAQDCLAGECLAACLAAKARLQRLAGDPTSALEMAGEAVKAAQRIYIIGCEMWGEIEMGLACLALGDLSSALEHSTRAVSLIPQAGQDWIGHEEAYYAHASVLRAINQDEAACLQELYARQAVQAKAGLISDPDQRQRYLSKSLSHQLIAG